MPSSSSISEMSCRRIPPVGAGSGDVVSVIAGATGVARGLGTGDFCATGIVLTIGFGPGFAAAGDAPTPSTVACLLSIGITGVVAVTGGAAAPGGRDCRARAGSGGGFDD